MQVSGNVVGRVVSIWRYPVKAMGPEVLQAAEVSWHGIVGDRRWAFIRDRKATSGFPWLTIRERNDLALYTARIVDEEARADLVPLIETPSGKRLLLTDPVLAAELGRGIRVTKHDRGTFDAMPLSLVSIQSLECLSEVAGKNLEALRFRPNFLIDAPGNSKFPEIDWVGRNLRIGDMTFRVDLRDKRCVVINVDPRTGARDPSVLKVVAREVESCVGVYGSVVQTGTCRIDDPILLLDGD